MRKKGFTLIEVLVTLGIIGTLMGAAVPVYVSKINIDHARKAGEEMLVVQQAARNFYRDHYSWPASIQELKDGDYLRADWDPVDPWKSPYEVQSTAHTFTVSAGGIPEKYQGGALMVLPQAMQDPADPSRITSTTAPPAEAIASRRLLHRSDDAEYRTMEGTLFVPRIESNDPNKPYYIDYDEGLAYVDDLYVEALGKNISQFNPTIHRQVRTVRIQNVYNLPYGSAPQRPGQVHRSWNNTHTVRTRRLHPLHPREWSWNGGAWTRGGGGHTITHHVPSGWTYSHAIPIGNRQPRVLRDSGNTGASATYNLADFHSEETQTVNLQIWGWRVE